MTLFTPNYNIPYAELGDVPNGPSQEQALASSVDTALHNTDVNVAALQAFGTLQTYTPTWAMGTPTGTPYGEYYLLNNKLVDVSASFVATAGVSLDVVTVSFTVPFASANPASLIGWAGTAVIGGGAGYIGDVVLGQNSNVAVVYIRHTLSGTIATPGNSGVSFVAGNYITANIRYRRA